MALTFKLFNCFACLLKTGGRKTAQPDNSDGRKMEEKSSVPGDRKPFPFQTVDDLDAEHFSCIQT